MLLSLVYGVNCRVRASLADPYCYTDCAQLVSFDGLVLSFLLSAEHSAEL
jgi:hypothetical protein